VRECESARVREDLAEAGVCTNLVFYCIKNTVSRGTRLPFPLCVCVCVCVCVCPNDFLADLELPLVFRCAIFGVDLSFLSVGLSLCSRSVCSIEREKGR
jgi:hypothetical protein